MATTKMKLLSLLTCICLLTSTASAHVQMSKPFPLRSNLDPQTPGELRDYDMTAPLQADGSNFPCKGYHKDATGRTVAQYQAGQKYDMQLSGSATHLGGSCQLSLSYDGGATFKVIKSMIGGCPISQQYDFTIPASAPSGKALFAWTWLNFEGNREFYMNCAEVEIVGSGNAGSLDDLPNIWVANLAGVNDCTLPSAHNAVFPHPGPDVLYGSGMSSTSPPSPGSCDGQGESRMGMPSDADPSFSSPPGTGVEHHPGNFIEISASSSAATPVPTLPVSSVQVVVPSITSTSMIMTSSVVLTETFNPLPPPTSSALVAASNPAASSDPMSSFCTASYTTYVPATRSTISQPPTSSCTGPVASCDCLTGFTCSAPNICTSICVLDHAQTTFVTVTSSTGGVTATQSATPTITTARTQATTDVPPYATNDPLTYLPCVPGTLLCTSPQAFLTCVYSPTFPATWIYGAPRAVADGMMCLPFQSPRSSDMTPTSGGGGGGGTTQSTGFYRDDRYVRARPYGSCAPDGSIQCVDAGSGVGSGFLACDQGGWINMGAVANGTVCESGRIVAV